MWRRRRLCSAGPEAIAPRTLRLPGRDSRKIAGRCEAFRSKRLLDSRNVAFLHRRFSSACLAMGEQVLRSSYGFGRANSVFRDWFGIGAGPEVLQESPSTLLDRLKSGPAFLTIEGASPAFSSKIDSVSQAYANSRCIRFSSFLSILLPDLAPKERASRSSHLSIDLQKELTKDCSFHPMFWPFWHCLPALRLNTEMICHLGPRGN